MSNFPANFTASQLFPIGSTGYTGTNTAQWPRGGQAASLTSTPLASNGADPDYWLPIWSGEVLTAYSELNIFEPLVTTETIESGTTKRFPITGTVKGKSKWLAGEELGGNEGVQTPGWFDISLDQRPMAAYFDLDQIHLMLTQWDYRAELSRQAGLWLANTRDKQIISMIAQAAFAPNRNPYGTGLAGMNNSNKNALPASATFNHLGNRLSTQTQRTDAALLLLDYLERYMVNLQEVDVPSQEIYCAVTPQAFQDIRALGIARDATGLVGGAGRPYFGGVAEAGGLGASLSQGMMNIMDSLEYMGVKIIKTNHIGEGPTGLYGNRILDGGTVNDRIISPSTGIVTEIGTLVDIGDPKYNFDFAQWTGNYASPTVGAIANPIKALIWQRNGVCSLRLQGMQTESVKDTRRGTYFTVSSIMAGAGILRPEVCGAIQGITANTVVAG